MMDGICGSSSMILDDCIGPLIEKEATLSFAEIEADPWAPLEDTTMMIDSDTERRVQFDLTRNQQYDTSEYFLDDSLKEMLWYNKGDFWYWRTSLQEMSQTLLHSVPEENSRIWIEALCAVYRAKVTISNLPQRTLAEVYSQVDDLVGLEYYLLDPSSQADARARKSAIRGALRLGTRSCAASSAYQRRHLSVLSRRLSQCPQRFAHEIANAQSQALSWSS